MRQPLSTSARFELALLLLAFLLLGAWALVAWFDWLPRLDRRQQAALDWASAAPPAPAKPGAVTRLWLAAHDIDAPERARLEGLAPEQMLSALATVPRHRLLPPAMNRDPEQALARALDDPEQLEAAVAAAAPLLEALPWLRESAHAHDALTPLTLYSNEGMPSLPLTAMAVRQLAAHALASGQAERALDLLCDDAAFWRSLLPGSNTLIVRMIAAATVRDHALFANAIAAAASPPSFPDRCEAALAALPAAAFDLCEPLRSELHYPEPGVEGQRTFAWRLLTHARHGEALRAEALADQCAAAGTTTPAAGQPACSPLERAFDHVGCTLASTRPRYDSFLARLHDVDATLRAVRLAAWLRSQDTDIAASFAERSHDLDIPGLALQQVGEAWRLSVPARARRSGHTSVIVKRL